MDLHSMTATASVADPGQFLRVDESRLRVGVRG